jgi:hypothetical protein
MSLRPTCRADKLPVDLPPKEKAMGMVSISDSYMALLQDYSQKTGVPGDRCVSDALFDWLAHVAPFTLQQMGLPLLKLGLRNPDIELVKPRKRRALVRRALGGRPK